MVNRVRPRGSLHDAVSQKRSQERGLRKPRQKRKHINVENKWTFDENYEDENSFENLMAITRREATAV